jgi:hypothetical protein
MDGTRFDAIARTLSTVGTRRESVKAVAAAGLGIGLASLGLAEADAKKRKKRCKKLGQQCKPRKKKCCGDLRCETRTGATNRTCCRVGLGEECSVAADCCEGGCLPPLVGGGAKTCKIVQVP